MRLPGISKAAIVNPGGTERLADTSVADSEGRVRVPAVRSPSEPAPITLWDEQKVVLVRLWACSFPQPQPVRTVVQFNGDLPQYPPLLSVKAQEQGLSSNSRCPRRRAT